MILKVAAKVEAFKIQISLECRQIYGLGWSWEKEGLQSFMHSMAENHAEAEITISLIISWKQASLGKYEIGMQVG